MAEPKKSRSTKSIDVEEPKGGTDSSGPSLHFEEQPSPDPEDRQTPEKFNEHIKSLVALFVDQELQEIERRLRDLEMLASNAGGVRFTEYAPGGVPDTPTYTHPADVPEYTPAHRETSDGGTPWY